ncbi:MAG: PilW family protein [Halieaceae bacterium]
MKKQTGMSLIELMVAMGLGIFLIAGVVNVFLANKDSTQVETSLARLQENGRIALDMLVSDIRDANYIGCTSGNANLDVMSIGASWTGVLGWERPSSGWEPTLPAALNTINTTARIGSDVINLQHSRSLNTTLAAPVVPSSTAVSVTSNPDCILQNESVIIASCVTAHLFRVTNSPACDGSATTFAYGAAGNSPTSISPGYAVDAQLLQFFDKTWYVRDTGRTRTAANIPVYALYRLFNGQEDEMVEGVEYMEILYGQELNTGNLRYVPANATNLDMDQVVSMRVGLLMQSFEMVLDTPDTTAYQVLDQSIDSTGTTITHNGDMTLRRVFQSTVLLRN